MAAICVEYCSHMHHAVGIDCIVNLEDVACGEEIVNGEGGEAVAGCRRCAGHVEVAARLFPDLFALGFAVAVVVVVGGAPEVGLQPESVGKIFLAPDLVGGHDA